MQPASDLILTNPGEMVDLFDGALRQCPNGPTVSILRIDIRDFGPRDCALMPLMRLLEIGGRMPHLRRLALANVMLQPLDLGALPSPFPYFAHLDTLVIEPWFAELSSNADITMSLFQAFAYVPQLRRLIVRSPMLPPSREDIHPTTGLPDLPFSLERFMCAGTLPILACAHIIARSQTTLTELEMTIMVTGDEDEAQLIASMAQAAPRLRYLNLHLRGNLSLVPRFQPVFAALARLASLRLTTPQNTTLPAALGLLAHAPANIPLRTLMLVHEGVPLDPLAVQRDVKKLIEDTPQTRRLRHLLLVHFYIGYEYLPHKLKIIELCRARCIRCQILG